MGLRQGLGDRMTRRDPTKSAPASSIKKADDRHPYGGVKPEPPTPKARDVAGPQPKPALRRRRPRRQAEEPYPEPKEKTATSGTDERRDS